MVVTCVAFTRSLPASGPLRELPIEAAATGHLDPRYLAGGRVRTGRLPDLIVEFRGRPIRLGASALHHRRVDLVDLVLEVMDEEAAGYLAAFDHTSAAVGAELFLDGEDRSSIAELHSRCARDLLPGDADTDSGSPFRRVVFHRDRADEDVFEGVPGLRDEHRVAASLERLDVHADTTVLPDERIGYSMVAGLAARSVLLVDAVTAAVDALAVAAGDPRADVRDVLERATETQRRAVVIQREVSPYRLLSPPLRSVAEHVDEVLGLGEVGRRDLDAAVEALRRLTESLFARSVEERTRTWERYGVAALVLLVAVTVVLLVEFLR